MLTVISPAKRLEPAPGLLPAGMTAQDPAFQEEARALAAVARGLPAVAEGKIVTFGITPDRPETGYGYIRSEPADTPGAADRVAQFVEKQR